MYKRLIATTALLVGCATTTGSGAHVSSGECLEFSTSMTLFDGDKTNVGVNDISFDLGDVEDALVVTNLGDLAVQFSPQNTDDTRVIVRDQENAQVDVDDGRTTIRSKNGMSAQAIGNFSEEGTRLTFILDLSVDGTAQFDIINTGCNQ